MRLIAAVILTAWLTAAPAHARPGDLDRSFANGGRSAYKLESGGYVAGLTLLGGQRPLLSVGAARGGKPAPTALTLTAGGRLASRTVFPPPAMRAPRFANGYALTQIGTAPTRYSLARIGATTGVTLTLPAVIHGRLLDLEAGGFGVDGRGRALVTVAYSLGLGKGDRTFALRYSRDGTLDPSYGSGGLAKVGNVPSQLALIRPDGRLYVLAGDDRRDTQVIALDARGRRVPGFRTRTLMSGRFVNYLSPHSIIAGGGGRLLVAGGGLYRSGWVVQLAADGRPDRRFGDRGLSAIPDFTANTIVRDRRGRLVVAGSADSSRGPFQAAVARLSARGRLDRGFGAGGVVSKQLGTLRGVTLVASEARHVALDDRGRIVIAGETYDDEYELRDDLGKSYPAIARLRG